VSVISKIKQLAKLKRKSYRDAYVGEHVKTSLPFQIRTLREQRGLSQRDLGEKTGMRQNAISRLEKPDYGSLSVNTLLRLASAFDVALLIKFVPFRKLLDEFSDLSTEALEVSSFDDELPELEEVASMATWYQRSYTQVTTNFDEIIGLYVDDTGAFRHLRNTGEAPKRAALRSGVYRNAAYVFRGGGASLVRGALSKTQVEDAMPLIDYTGESEEAIQTDLREVYKFTPFIFWEGGRYVRVDS
jgi:transcriptional regulator with XRE-family HTH domain